MKNILICLVLCAYTVQLYAQQAPTFQFTMYFTDAKGNQDSIELGYAPDAHSIDFIDPQYGEEDVTDVPFDTVLDVRVYMFRYYTSSLYLNKQIVGYNCDIIDATADDLVIYTKYPPLKISWNKDLFYSYDYPCHDFAYICADDAPFADCGTCLSIRYLQFADYRNVTFEEYYSYRTTQVSLEDGTMGTAYKYYFGFISVPWSEIVGVKEPTTTPLLEIRPSIAQARVELIGDFEVGANARVVGVTGMEYACTSTSTSEGLALDVSALPSGMYLVHIPLKEGNKTAVGRFVKL